MIPVDLLPGKMSHAQPSPTGAVTPHHGHLAAHPQVNGHLPLQAQGQKGPPLSTAQKIAALNEQVWLQIGMYPTHRVSLIWTSPSIDPANM